VGAPQVPSLQAKVADPVYPAALLLTVVLPVALTVETLAEQFVSQVFVPPAQVFIAQEVDEGDDHVPLLQV